GGPDDVAEELSLVRREAAEDPGVGLPAARRTADAELQTQEVRAEARRDVLDAPLTSAAAALLEAQAPQRQVDVVVDHQQLTGASRLTRQLRLHGAARQVHEAGRLEQ